MGLFDKLKNVFLEDDFDEDIPVVKEEKKEVKKTEEKIEEPKVEVRNVPLDNTFSDRELLEPKEKFKFPVIFEEEDFKEDNKKNTGINLLERDNNKYEQRVVEPVKKEKKVFKPSPVISPVYGVLDKNYSKEDITTKDGLLNDYDKVDIDFVIKKASGEYSSKESKKEEPKKEVKKEVESEEFIDLFAETEEVTPVEVIENNKEEIDEKIKSIDELLKDTGDEDFYSLVDNMYKDGVDE